MLTLKMKKTPATLVASLAFACAVFAAERTLPTPPASPCPDTESSLCVPLPDWPSLGRRVTFTLTANTTPSNCVQVALGQDSNDDSILAPEETHLVLGVDCGVPFIRDESKSKVEVEQWNLSTYSAGQPEQEANHHCSPSTSSSPHPSTFTFSFKQPSDVSRRCTHAKVTTRGRGNSAAEIAAEITRPGVALILR